MISPLPVLRLVIDSIPFYLNLSCGVVALEVRHIIKGVPQAEFDGADCADLLYALCVVGEGQCENLTLLVKRHESCKYGLKSVLC